jgi:tRNA(Arg) A34 adenosine deaminase TadA
MKTDSSFLELAIEKSKESSEKGLFPAGALVVKGQKVLASEISGKFPKAFAHADYKAVSSAFNKLNKQLVGCTLYCSMEPCLMCIGKAYWAGISRIVYAIGKSSISDEYFEGMHDNHEVMKVMNRHIEFIHLDRLQKSALDIVKDWERRRIYNK